MNAKPKVQEVRFPGNPNLPFNSVPLYSGIDEKKCPHFIRPYFIQRRVFTFTYRQYAAQSAFLARLCMVERRDFKETALDNSI